MTAAPRRKAAAAKPEAPKPAWQTAHLMIGTPAYGGMVHIDYLRSLFEYTRAGIQYRFSAIGNESLITRARNSLLAGFHARPELTHLLFLDADTCLPVEGLQRMLSARAAVIGAPVALKGYDAAGNRLWNVGRSRGVSGSLLKVDKVGTAALLLSRAACTALVEDAIAHGRVYRRPSTMRGDMDSPVHYDVFRVGVHEGEYLSEDYWVCRRLIDLGFDVLIDPSVITTHQGIIAV